MKTILGIIVLLAILGGGYYLINKNHKTDMTQDGQTNLNYDANQSTTGDSPTQTPPPVTPEPTNTTTSSDHPVATIETTMGNVTVTLDHTAAPKTVENFVKLAKQGFYNGLKFHRVIPGFVVQGGDPKGDGTGGPGYTVPAEIKLTHKIGAIATARTGDQVNPDRASSGSQFYIALQALPQLDGQYTVFGYVTAGMDVVAKIGATPTDPTNDMPLKDVLINKITIKE
jgi:cyclophilin family peptidyl-prolyl cis-trans isomerase